MENDLEKFKNNPKTKYLFEAFENLLREEKELLVFMSAQGGSASGGKEGDAELNALADEEHKKVAAQKEALMKQMGKILTEDKEEGEFPNEIVLEVRAGAGGEEAA